MTVIERSNRIKQLKAEVIRLNHALMVLQEEIKDEFKTRYLPSALHDLHIEEKAIKIAIKNIDTERHKLMQESIMDTVKLWNFNEA